MSNRSNRNILIDGNNLLHRIHAIYVDVESPLTSSSGYPTGLIYGVFSVLSDWISDISNITKMELFLDGVPKRRLEIDAEYKQKEVTGPGPGKIDHPIKLLDGFLAKNQLDVIVHLFQLMGVNLYFHPDEEADDVIASYVEKYENDVNIIISSDKDFYQLLARNPRVILYRPGISGNRFFDAEKAEEDLLKKYKVSVPPSNIRMFKALTGDTSDGIKGVPRLRKKVAAPLCSCTSVEELYQTNFPGFSKSEKDNILGLKDRIAKNYELVGFKYDLDVESMKLQHTENFDLAVKILKEDFNIYTFQPHTFKFNKVNLRTSFEVVPDFLTDI